MNMKLFKYLSLFVILQATLIVAIKNNEFILWVLFVSIFLMFVSFANIIEYEKKILGAINELQDMFSKINVTNDELENNIKKLQKQINLK